MPAQSPRPKPPEFDRDLVRGGVRETSADAIYTHRVLATVVRRPGQSLSVAEIAKATGLLEDTVREALSSREFLDLLNEQARLQIGALLGKALSRVQKMLDNDAIDDTPKLTLEAARTLATVYRTLTVSESKHDGMAAEGELDALMQRLEAANRIRPASFTIQSTKEAVSESADLPRDPESHQRQPARRSRARP